MIITDSDPLSFLMRRTLGDTTDNFVIRPGQARSPQLDDDRVPLTEHRETP
jgi:hypothetical protein